MRKTIMFIEDGNPIADIITTELNISPDFIQMKLALYHEKMTEEGYDTGDLYAKITDEFGEVLERYEFDYQTGLRKV